MMPEDEVANYFCFSELSSRVAAARLEYEVFRSVETLTKYRLNILKKFVAIKKCTAEKELHWYVTCMRSSSCLRFHF